MKFQSISSLTKEISDYIRILSVDRRYFAGVTILIVAAIALICFTIYSNSIYPWPTEEEFKTEMVLVEAEYPGLVHTLLTMDTSNDAQRWAQIQSLFGIVDWDTWPWKNGAFYRQFNPPSWVKFFDTYEAVTITAISLFGFVAYRTWKRAEKAVSLQKATILAA